MDPQLLEELKRAIRHKRFSVVETIALCTGRYTKRNKLTPKAIDEMLASDPPKGGLVPENQRPEYGERYRALTTQKTKIPEPLIIEK